MNYIEQRLCTITEDNKEGRRYYNQWELAKDYMPKVLQSISQYFPHYSLHDETHSESILNNIVKILGEEKINRMSVVDLWLLLTSAYYHDTGMYISAEDKNKILCPDSEFLKYLAKKQANVSSPMYEYACLFSIKEQKIFYKNEQLTSQNIDALRFLIADYFRSHHAERSAERTGFDLSLNLPGNPIPQRIIKLLGKICRAHTQNQSEVLKLPKVESSGCGTENCHPLYIACLLRLGDLLDIDTNRVSEVLLSTLPGIPADSVDYLATNRDITHIHIDQSVIEMTASCKKYEVASLVDKWFEMIKSEVSFQSKNWHLIVPDASFGALPSTGRMIVELEGYDNFSLDEKPQFKIDDDRAIEMLQGAGLYDSHSQCIRELLQNAVDATYLRTFKEHREIQSVEEFQEICAKDDYRIEVIVKKKKIEGDYVYWQVKITDHGIGIAKDELKYLSCTGSSSQNEAKQKIIASMPAWMRPSGTFGIGFQSVFLITDKVKMETRRWGREDTLELELYNPTGKEKGNILLKTVKDEDRPFGTTICFEVKRHIKPEWNYEKGKECPDIYVDRDYWYNETSRSILERIIDFSRFSPVKIQLNDRDMEGEESNHFDFYDEGTGLQVKLARKDEFSKLFFKNQEIRSFSINLPFLDFCINILCGDAKDILTLNRNEVMEEYRIKLRKDILISTYHYLIKEFDQLPDDDDYDGKGNSTKQLAAAFIDEMISHTSFKTTIEDQKLKEYWEKIKIKSDDNNAQNKTIGELLNSEKTEYIDIVTEIKHISFVVEYKTIVSFCDNTNEVLFRGMSSIFLLRKAHNYFKGIQFNAKGIRISKETTTHFIKEDDDTRKRLIEDVYSLKDRSRVSIGTDNLQAVYDDSSGLSFLYPNRSLYSRENMPCNEKYDALRINSDWYEPTFYGYNFDVPVMLCPYLHTPDDKLKFLVDDELINYVYEHRYHQEVTKEQIKETYDMFHEDFKKVEERLSREDKLI